MIKYNKTKNIAIIKFNQVITCAILNYLILILLKI